MELKIKRVPPRFGFPPDDFICPTPNPQPVCRLIRLLSPTLERLKLWMWLFARTPYSANKPELRSAQQSVWSSICICNNLKLLNFPPLIDSNPSEAESLSLCVAISTALMDKTELERLQITLGPLHNTLKPLWFHCLKTLESTKYSAQMDQCYDMFRNAVSTGVGFPCVRQVTLCESMKKKSAAKLFLTFPRVQKVITYWRTAYCFTNSSWPQRAIHQCMVQQRSLQIVCKLNDSTPANREIVQLSSIVQPILQKYSQCRVVERAERKCTLSIDDTITLIFSLIGPSQT